MSDDALPTVSVVLPALNEGEYIEGCLASLLAQDYPAVTEILVVDGGSTDGTVALAEAFGPPVRVVPNPRVTAAAALNIGISEAAGELICRADAHAEYADDYIRRCVEVLLETGADNVGGPVRAVGRTPFGRAVAAVFSSPLGTGPAPSHYATDRRDGDTVWLGCWRRETLEALGGFDEDRLQWAAEDQELNFRIRRRGGRIVLDPSIRVTYFPRAAPRPLWDQYFNWGVAKASTLVKHRALPTLRPLAPAVLVVATATGLVTGRTWRRRLLVPAVHAAFAGATAVWLASREDVDAPRVFAALEICHWSYGVGFFAGLFRAARGRSFETRPRGHRQPAPRGAWVAPPEDPRCTIAQ